MTREEENKLIERTCKYHAYARVWMWARRATENFEPEHGSPAWFAAQKMAGHREFLKNHEYRYAYHEGFIKNDGYYGK
jgi:hypothetical protein